MRRLSFVFLIVLLAACGKSPAGPPPAQHDPYWGAILDARTITRFPDTAFVAITFTARRPDSSVIYVDSTSNGTYAVGCGEMADGQGYPDEYLVELDLYVIDGPHDVLVATRQGPDTLARYHVPLFPAMHSPFTGWGDDPDHSVIWRATLTDTSGATLVPVPERENPIGDFNWGTHCNGAAP